MRYGEWIDIEIYYFCCFANHSTGRIAARRLRFERWLIIVLFVRNTINGPLKQGIYQHPTLDWKRPNENRQIDLSDTAIPSELSLVVFCGAFMDWLVNWTWRHPIGRFGIVEFAKPSLVSQSWVVSFCRASLVIEYFHEWFNRVDFREFAQGFTWICSNSNPSYVIGPALNW